MTTDRTGGQDLLTITQWLSPVFPVGGYAYSHGLDWTVAAGELGGEDDFRNWLTDTLCYGAGRTDAILLSLCHRSAVTSEELCVLAAALATGSERWLETLAQGTAFIATTNAILGTRLPPMPLPIAVAVQARSLDLPTAMIIALYLQSFASNLASIATRIIPLGQTAAQRVLTGMTPTISRIAQEAETASTDDLATSVFRGDLASLRHETQEVRLFRT